jgi:outer membrane lipoprotein
MNKHRIYLLEFFTMLILVAGGCATTPVFDTQGVDQGLTPKAVVEQADSTMGKKILWGGTILSIQNQQASTQIEMLAYPLNSSHQPVLQNETLGRFILKQSGFLEPSTYAAGRWATVLGRLESMESGEVGGSSYQYPVVQAQQIKLWPRPGEEPGSNVFFGIGIQIHN